MGKDTKKGEKGSLVRIGEAAKKAGISGQTLQYYVLVGLVEPACRSASGQRLFDEQCIRRIKLIRRLNRSGYTLRAIRQTFLSRGPSAKKR